MSYYSISAFSFEKSSFKVQAQAKSEDSCRTLGELLLEATQFPSDIVYSFLIMDEEGDPVKEIFADDSFVEEDNEAFAVVDDYTIADLAKLVERYTCLFVFDPISGKALNLMLSLVEGEDIPATQILSVEGEAPILEEDDLDALLDSINWEEEFEEIDEDFLDEFEEEL